MKELLVCCLLIILASVLVLGYDASNPVWQADFKEYSHHQVVAFYHLHNEDDTNYKLIIEQQLEVLDNSGLFQQLDALFYTTSGDKGEFFRLQNDKFHFLTYLGVNGAEFETLALLQRYCRNHETTKVLYFHNKHEAQLDFRWLLDCFVLTPHCLAALATHETCGWRLAPFPYIHYAGNYWWAQCQYVNRLIDPLSIVANQTFIEKSRSLSECVGSTETALAEAWLGSLPQLQRPSDCLSSAIDTKYFTGGKSLPGAAARAYCPNTNPGFTNEGSYGTACDLAAAVKEPDLFSATLTAETQNHPKVQCRKALVKEMQERSQVWYGHPPLFYNEWIPKLEHLPNITEGDLIRPAHSRQVYYFKNRCMHPIANWKTFKRLGLSFDKVIAIPDHQMEYFPKCQMD